MQNLSELLALREYVQTLQRENQAKTIEQQTLYREFQALDTELKSMERYYYRNRELNKEIQDLRLALNNQSLALMQVEQRQQQISFLREEVMALQNHSNISNQTITQLETLSQNQSYKIQRLEQDLTSLSHQNNLMKRKREEMASALQQKQDENQALRQKLYEFSQDQKSQTQRNLQELAQNYEKIELIVLEKQEQIRQMELYINQLEQQCQFLDQQCIKFDKYIKKLQYDIKSLQMRRPSRDTPQDNLSFLTDSISKVQLMRQNNRMLERIVKYEKENNQDNDSSSQRWSYSECGQGRNTNSPSKLQMRIHTLKVENQHLLRTLAI